MYAFIPFTSASASFKGVFCLRVSLKETFIFKSSGVLSFLSSTITIIFSSSLEHLGMGAVIGKKLNYLTNVVFLKETFILKQSGVISFLSSTITIHYHRILYEEVVCL